jgi:carboxypeptidase family protein
MNLVRTDSKNRSGAWTKHAVQLLGGIFAILLLCLPAFSQGSYGRILGTVTDQSGGVVTGATVTVIDTDRGVTRTLTTDDAGAFNAPNLTAGNYTVRAEAKGFKRIERQGVVIEVGHEVRVDLTVQPGEQSQTVTVTESVPLVETTNATMGGTLENADVVDLPLNGRDYQNLLALRPGVTLYPGGGPWTQSSNGTRPDNSVWMVEGVVNFNPFDARPIENMPSPFTDAATILPIDAIQEFNVMENPKAEYGWKDGAVVNVGIKSGTNTIHGSVYGFYRSAAWDARNYYNIAPIGGVCALNATFVSVCNKLPTQLKQYGATVGGPIKKDKLFYFGGFEGLHDIIALPYTIGVPSTASVGNPAQSDVDAINAANAGGVAISKVSLEMLCPNAVGQALPLATTFVCTGGLLPQTGTSQTGFLSTFPNLNTSYNGIGKIDYHLGDRDQINGTFFASNYATTGEDRPFTNVAFTDTAPIKVYSNTESWVHTASSSVVNEMRFGYSRVSFEFDPLDLNVVPNGVGYPVNTGVTIIGGLPSIDIAGFKGGGADTLGTATNRPQGNAPNPIYDFQDSLSILKGNHSFKFGAEFSHMEADVQIYNQGRGRIRFPTLESFFEGEPSGANLEVGAPGRATTSMNIAGFLQDDYRLTPKLMLNLGLRYEYFTPEQMQGGLWANFLPSQGLVQQGFGGQGSLYTGDHTGFEPRLGFAYDLSGKGTTVIRGGASLIRSIFPLDTLAAAFGLQNDTGTSPINNPTAAILSCTPGFGGEIGCPATPGGTNALGVTSLGPGQLCWDAPPVGSRVNCGAPVGQNTVFPSSANINCGDGVGTNPGPCDAFGISPNLRIPFTVNYNLAVTHQFGADTSVEVAYVGNHGFREFNFHDINQSPLGSAWCMNTPTAAQTAGACAVYGGVPATETAAVAAGASAQAVQEARPFFAQYPYLGFINYLNNASYSNYNGLQVSINHRMSHGLSFVVGYTYSHALDNGSLNRFGGLPENSYNTSNEYGNSDFDIRHRFTITATYNIPGFKTPGQMLEGWQINTIYSYSTPQPWTAFDQNGDDFSGDGEVGSNGNGPDRWDIFGSPLDFPAGKDSNPYCTGYTVVGGVASSAGASCSVTTVYGNIAAPAGVNPQACVTSAPDPNTLAAAGCYISTNGRSVIVPPALGTFGNMGRNIFRDYGFQDWDMSLFKNFKWRERFGAQLRLEVFNVLNRPVPGNPYGGASFVNSGNGLGAGGFGYPGGTNDLLAGNPLIGSGSNRALQVGLKVTF